MTVGKEHPLTETRSSQADDVVVGCGIAYDYGIPKDTFVLQDGKPSPFPADPIGLIRTDVLDAADKLALVRLFVALGAAKLRTLTKMSVQEWLDRKVRRPQLRRLMTA